MSIITICDITLLLAIVCSYRQDTIATYVAFWPPYKRGEKAKAAVLTMEQPGETWGEFFVKVLKTYGETD